MRTFVAAGAAVALATSGALAAQQINGNWYDKEVTKLDYDFTPSGAYMEVVSMDETTGNCEQRERQYDSPIGPFSEEVRRRARPSGSSAFAGAPSSHDRLSRLLSSSVALSTSRRSPSTIQATTRS